ncbi:MAG: aspartate kinase [Candidatus Brocadiaceae bacterium]|nr:aspartate kinase [Candidatus Brocadiaceae bacterium]
MALVVQKFGGSSLATADKVLNAARRAVAEFEAGHQVLMVCSAQGKMTDELIERARRIHAEPSRREVDMLLAVGEQMSISLMAIALHSMGYEAISLTGAQAGIRTDNLFGKAKIRTIDTSRVRRELDKGQIVIVAGFQGADEEGNITTIGRGGSDATAIALAAVLGAARCEIFTDVDGIYTADPRIVSSAAWIRQIDYDELLELASLGLKAMQSRAVELAKRLGVSFRVRSSLNNSEGTLVTHVTGEMEFVDVRAAALDRNQAKITIRHVPDTPGVAATIFSDLGREHVNVDMIVQNVGEGGMTDVSFTVEQTDLARAIRVTSALAERIGAGAVESDEEVAKVSVVGIGMRSHSGVAEKMFRALAEAMINIMMISTSEIKISCVVEAARAEDALRVVHDAFDLKQGTLSHHG